MRYMPTTATLTVEIKGVGDLLHLWRFVAGLSQAELADRVSDLMGESVSAQTILRYERGELNLSTRNVPLILAITEALGHKTNELPDDVLAKREELVRLIRSRCFVRNCQPTDPMPAWVITDAPKHGPTDVTGPFAQN